MFKNYSVEDFKRCLESIRKVKIWCEEALLSLVCVCVNLLWVGLLWLWVWAFVSHIFFSFIYLFIYCLGSCGVVSFFVFPCSLLIVSGGYPLCLWGGVLVQVIGGFFGLGLVGFSFLYAGWVWGVVQCLSGIGVSCLCLRCIYCYQSGSSIDTCFFLLISEGPGIGNAFAHAWVIWAIKDPGVCLNFIVHTPGWFLLVWSCSILLLLLWILLILLFPEGRSVCSAWVLLYISIAATECFSKAYLGWLV